MQEIKPKYGNFSSIDNPEKLSESVASFVKIVGVIIGAIGTVKGSHIVIDSEIIQQTTDALIVVITSGFAIWQSAQFLFGIFRKIVAKR